MQTAKNSMPSPKEVIRFNPQTEITIPFTGEWPVNEIEKADVEVSKAARAIRLYYYRQIPLLRQIPYLALEADGRGGWLDGWRRAYDHCLMAIHQEDETCGSYDMFIELRSGVLIGAESSSSHYVITQTETIQYGGDTSWNLASDKEIYTKLAHQDKINRFNPAAEIETMQQTIKKPYHNSAEELEYALELKARYKEKLDAMMAVLSYEQVMATLSAQGFKL